jgi:hypothetical protein
MLVQRSMDCRSWRQHRDAASGKHDRHSLRQQQIMQASIGSSNKKRDKVLVLPSKQFSFVVVVVYVFAFCIFLV